MLAAIQQHLILLLTLRHSGENLPQGLAPAFALAGLSIFMVLLRIGFDVRSAPDYSSLFSYLAICTVLLIFSRPLMAGIALIFAATDVLHIIGILMGYSSLAEAFINAYQLLAVGVLGYRYGVKLGSKPMDD